MTGVVTDPLILVGQWERPVNQMVRVCHGFGCAVVFWPSGVRTLVEYAGVVSIPEYRYNAIAMAELMVTREINLARTLQEFRQRIHPPGWWIVSKKGRKQARRVRAVAFLNPTSYKGPAPIKGDRI